MSKKKILCSLICLLCFVALCSAQTQLNLQQQVQLARHDWPLDELMQQVTKQTGVHFSINTKKFPSTRRLHIKNLKQSVNALLAEIKQTTGIAYMQVGTHIIMLDQLPGKKSNSFNNIKLSPSVQKPVTTHTKTVNRKDENNSAQEKSGANKSQANTIKKTEDLLISDTNSTSVDAVTVHTAETQVTEADLNSSIVQSSQSILAKPEVPAISISSSPPFHKSLQRSLIRKKEIISSEAISRNSKSRNKPEFEKYTGFFSSIGTSTDDVLYVHNSIMGGHTFAYGIIGYTTNIKRGGLRYGIGSGFPLSTRWNIHLQLSTGKLNFKYDSGLNVTKAIRSDWHQLALKMEYKITKKLRLQFGPVYNLLKSKMVFNDIPGDFLTELEIQMINNYTHTLYTIKDEVSKENGTLLKTWIGLQAGIYFNLDFSK